MHFRVIFELIWRDYFKFVALKFGDRLFYLSGKFDEAHVRVDFIFSINVHCLYIYIYIYIIYIYIYIHFLWRAKHMFIMILS